MLALGMHTTSAARWLLYHRSRRCWNSYIEISWGHLATSQWKRTLSHFLNVFHSFWCADNVTSFSFYGPTCGTVWHLISLTAAYQWTWMRAVAQHCINGDSLSQWKRRNLTPTCKPKPLYRLPTNWYSWLRPGDDPLPPRQISCKSVHRALIGK